jgi:integrase
MIIMPKRKKGPTISPHTRGGFYTTLTVNKEKKFIYGATEDEVYAKYVETLSQYGQGYNVHQNPTMLDYAISWYNIFKRGKGAIKTQEMYANAVNVHIIPALGKKRIKEITTSDVQKLLNKTNSSKSLQHKVKITLNQIFKAAMADRIIAFNPVAGTVRVETEEPNRNFLSRGQLDILLHILKEHKIFPLSFTILNTGLRATEAIALMRTRDVDLENQKIHVRESTEFIKSKPRRKDTKTKRGVREIPIPSSFAAWLEEYLKAPKSLYVFPGHHGGQMGKTEMRNAQRRANRKIQKWFDQAEIAWGKRKDKEDLTAEEKEMLKHFDVLLEEFPDGEGYRFNLHFKTLRHTYCTELFDLGIDEVSAAAIMGHAVTVMREIYTHIQRRRKIKTVEKIEGLYGSVTDLPEKNIRKTQD